MKNIIFIEGVSGVGKTSTVTLLAERLKDLGYSVNYYLEGDSESPLDLSSTFKPTITIPISKFTEVFLHLWQRFVDSEEVKNDYVIFDASFISHMTSDLIRNYNASEDVIENHLNRLLQIIKPLNPIIYYLSSEDVSDRLIKARLSRGQSPPSSEQITFWNQRKQIDINILSRLSIEAHIVNISKNNWDSMIDEIVLMIDGGGSYD